VAPRDLDNSLDLGLVGCIRSSIRYQSLDRSLRIIITVAVEQPPPNPLVSWQLFNRQQTPAAPWTTEMVFPGRFSTGCMRCRQRKVKVGAAIALTQRSEYGGCRQITVMPTSDNEP
jgi:hypothetical protein